MQTRVWKGGTNNAEYRIKNAFMEKINGNLILIGLMGAGKPLWAVYCPNVGSSVLMIVIMRFVRHQVSLSPSSLRWKVSKGFAIERLLCSRNWTAMKDIILSTGGGSVLREENRQNMRRNGTVVYLHASPEVLLERDPL